MWIKQYIITFVCCLVASCANLSTPVENSIVKVRSSSTSLVCIKSYTIPKGVFRGVLWPSTENPKFEPWIIKSEGEVFFSIPAPPETAKWTSWVDDQWRVKEGPISKGKKLYTFDRKDGTKSLVIELPQKRRNYKFSMLRNDSDEETIIFMDIDEKISDTGLFGYIVME